MNIIIGHNGSGKTKYIEDKYFGGKRLKIDAAHLEEGGGEKSGVFYMHASALLKPMENPKNAFLNQAIEVDGWHSFAKWISDIFVNSKKDISIIEYSNNSILSINWYDSNQYDSIIMKYIKNCLNYESNINNAVYKEVLDSINVTLFFWMKKNKKDLTGLEANEMMKIFINSFSYDIQYPLTEIKELFIAGSILRKDLTSMKENLNTMLKDAGLNFGFEIKEIDELYTKKREFNFVNEKNNIDFTKLSTGERTLLNLVLQIFLRTNAKNTDIPIIILDEIDAFLNAKSIKEIKNGVKSLAKEVYLITHNPLSVALFDNEKYSLLENGNIRDISKNQAIDFLLSGANNINLRTYSEIIVYCESKYDARFLTWQQKNQQKKLDLFFAPCSSSAARGGKANVKMIAESFGKSQSKNIAFIIDWDGIENEDLDSQIFVNSERYSLENFLLDPFLLSFAHPNKKDEIFSEFNSLFNDDEMVETSYFINESTKTEKLPKQFMNTKIKDGEWHKWVKHEIPSFQNNIYISNFAFKSVSEMMNQINTKNKVTKD